MIPVEILYLAAILTLAAPSIAVVVAARGVLANHLKIFRREMRSKEPGAPAPAEEATPQSVQSNNSYEQRLGFLTRGCSLISLVASLALAIFTPAHGELRFVMLFTSFYLDALSVYFVLLVNLVAFFSSWYTVDFLNRSCVGQVNTMVGSGSTAKEEKYAPASTEQKDVFHLLFNLFHVTMLLVPMVANLVVLWMAIELTTLASTLLVSFRRDRKAVEAAWKYIIITTVGIIFALFGTIFLATAVGEDACKEIAKLASSDAASCNALREGPWELWAAGAPNPDVNLMHWSVLARSDVANKLDAQFVILSFIFILVGYGTKAGLAPMHTWLPDGHGQAPSPVSALLSGVLLKSALYAILRFLTIANLNDPINNPSFTGNLLLFFGLLSLVLATPFILKANPFKRVLAYHSLEHMGIIAFGLGVGGSLALFGALLHSLNHALTKALMFLTFGYVGRHFPKASSPEADKKTECRDADEDNIQGVLSVLPGAGFILLLGGLALVGAPPFNIFLSELLILWAALERAFNPGNVDSLQLFMYQIAIVLFLVTLAIIFGGLVRHLARLLLGQWQDKEEKKEKKDQDDQKDPAAGGANPSREAIWPLVLLLIIILVTGMWIPNAGINLVAMIEQSTCIIEKGAKVCLWEP
jgi:hydrogenase-4 component F